MNNFAEWFYLGQHLNRARDDMNKYKAEPRCGSLLIRVISNKKVFKFKTWIFRVKKFNEDYREQTERTSNFMYSFSVFHILLIWFENSWFGWLLPIVYLLQYPLYIGWMLIAVGLPEQTSQEKSILFISQKSSEITARDWLLPTISDHVKRIYSCLVKNQEKY